MRRFQAAALLVIVLCLPGLSCRQQSPSRQGQALTLQEQINAAEALNARGEHEQAFAEAERLLASLPGDAQAAGWEIPFNERLVPDARLGRRFGYFVVHKTHQDWTAEQRNEPRTLTRPDLPVLEKYAIREPVGRNSFATITCVDLATGQRLWTRPLELSLIGIDPRDDGVWVWQMGQWPRVEHWDARTGETSREHALPSDLPVPSRPEELGGIRDGNVSIWQRPSSPRPSGRGVELDLELMSFADSNPPQVLSPNRLAFLELTPPEGPDQLQGIALRPVGPFQRPIWTCHVPGYPVNRPTWMRDPLATPEEAARAADVLALAGDPHSYGTAYRIDGATGEVRWRRPLAEPAYSPRSAQLRNNSYAREGWSPVALMDSWVVAIGHHNGVYLLEPDSGEIRARHQAPAPLLDAPRLVDGRMVLVTFDGMRAVPLQSILAPDDSASLRLRHVQVKALLGLGRSEEAIDLARVLLEELPGSARAWRAFAEAAERADAEEARSEAPAAWARHMQLAGLEVLPELEHSHGLVRRIDSAPVVAPLVPGALVSYAVTTAGEMLSIDSRTGEVVEREPIPEGVKYLVLIDRTLNAIGYANRRIPLRTLAQVPELEDDDPLWGWRDPEAGDPRPGPRDIARFYPGAVAVEGRVVVPSPGGGVRVLEGGTFTDFPALGHEVGPWQIARVGDRLLGYGRSGLWELDDHFRPRRRIIDLRPSDPGGPRDTRGAIYAVAGDEQTVGLIVGPSERPALQIFSSDGTRKLSEAAVGSAGDERTAPQRLHRLADGYLFCGRGLNWVADDPQRPVWRFDLHTSLLPPPPRNSPWDPAELGVPRIIGDRILVAAKGGGIYIFSIPTVTGE